MQRKNAWLNESRSFPRLLPAPPSSGGDAPASRRLAPLSPLLNQIAQETRRDLALSNNVPDVSEYAENNEQFDRRARTALQNVARRTGVELSSFERDAVLAHIELDAAPFGPLQPLVDNREISDIIVTSFDKVTVQRARRNMATDCCFASPEAYESFLERLLLRAETTYSTKQPIADGMIGDYARIHAVHKCLCESGPYLTIRLNRMSTVSLDDLSASGFAPQAVLQYLTAVVASGQTVFVAGEVGTGKTTLTRALAATMPHDDAILVIEDTPEIRLSHPQVRYLYTRDENSDGAGKVSPAECIRGGMRMAMNRIIFGEIRDAEAAEAFVDVCASGHPGISTIHARSAIDAVSRLELFLARAQPGTTRAVLSEQIATAVQVIVHVKVCRGTGKRRIAEVLEVGPVADGVLRQRPIFRYRVQNNAPQWSVVSKVSAHREALETAASPLYLSKYPQTLFLDSETSRGQGSA